jgi:hypothetical protein
MLQQADFASSFQTVVWGSIPEGYLPHKDELDLLWDQS